MKIIARKNDNYMCANYGGANTENIAVGTEFELAYGEMYASRTLVWFKTEDGHYSDSYNSCGFNYFIDGQEVSIYDLRDMNIIERCY